MRLTIGFNEQDRTLYAELTTNEESEEISMHAVKQKVEEAGYRNLNFPANAIAELLANAQQGKESTVALKTLIDATASVTLANDKQRAFLTLTTADGGTLITLDNIFHAIATAGVSTDLVDREAVNTCLEQQSVKDVCIAQGRLPQKGKDAEFISLVDSEMVTPPTVDEHGVADMMHTHQFVIVEVGTPLMRRVPATQGEPGTDVTGSEIKPTPGNDMGFSMNLTGAIISPEDPNLLIAQVKGHPLVEKQGVHVDPTLHLDSVDVNTGDISFDGSLEVKGEVVAGLSIDVTGDVIIQGGVDRAMIKAGHNIKIGGGIFGEEETKGITETPIEYCLKAGADIEAKFVNLATLQAENNIVIKEYLNHSYVKAGNQLLLGQEGGKGIVFGGHCEALHRITANQIGNEGYIPTYVTAGHLSEVYKVYHNLENEFAARTHEAEQLAAVHAKIQQGDPILLGKIPLDKSQKIQNTILAIQEKMARTQNLLTALEPEIELQKKATIEVTKTIYPNTIMTINGTAKLFSEKTEGSTWIQLGSALMQPGKDHQPATPEKRE
ncbi:FapA family protein [Candidatus Nitronereus thalassa]|uniref:FapA family protein n=1 Tax=Candidatus Nitronereus thalassa TaxID=3020898 RepID=A0ABU3K3I9_9BACT|nr:FapA family protein [Candidatus Nitronereus thalassa]MDT7040942.1 FapA family protein [Candidatus Nitronereus thalassa]